MSDRPLLCGNTEVYDGPFTPTKGLEGKIHAQGLVPGLDEVVIVVMDPRTEECEAVITMQFDAELSIGPIPQALIRARRTKSSGAEVHVWVS